MSPTHTCQLQPTGRVLCWGANRHGELGDGTRQMRTRPVVVAGIDDALQLGVRQGQTCVRRRSGVVSCWGRKLARQVDELEPTEVEALRGVTDLAVADQVLCGLQPSGEIVCLPSAGRDQALPSVGPPPGEPVKDAVDLAAVSSSLCACHREGTVTCWNMQPHGKLTPRERRTRVDGIHDAVQLVAAGTAKCAIRASGTASCWDGRIVTIPGTIRAGFLGGVHDFGSVGQVTDMAFLGWPDDQDCATLSSGKTVCWPPPYLDPPDSPISIKAKPLKLPPAFQIEAVGPWGAGCALTRDQQVFCWGDRSMGRLGSGRPPEQPSPQVVDGVAGAVAVVASDGRACARASSGKIQCWGNDQPVRTVELDGMERLLSGRCASVRGELVCFDGLFERPLPASGLRDITQLVPAARGSRRLSYFALNRTGEVFRVDWQRSTRTAAPGWSRRFVGPVRGLGRVRRLVDASQQTCALGEHTHCWSSLSKPPASAEDEFRPDLVELTMPVGFSQVQLRGVWGAESYKACGVKGAKIGCWNQSGEIRWLELSGVRRFRICPGGPWCALHGAGTLSCWSDGGGAITGDGSVGGRTEPTPVPGLTDVAGFSCVQRSLQSKPAVYAWQRDGRLLAWGINERGQLGWPASSTIVTPMAVEGTP